MCIRDRLGSWSIDVYLIPIVMLAPTISDRSTSRLYRSVEIGSLSVDLLESSSELALTNASQLVELGSSW